MRAVRRRLHDRRPHRGFGQRDGPVPATAFLHLGRICLGVFFLVTGAQHFLYTAFVASLIPAWFPGDAVFWTYFTGIALLGGLGLLVRRTAGLAALLAGLMVFSWFWIIHVPRTLET